MFSFPRHSKLLNLLAPKYPKQINALTPSLCSTIPHYHRQVTTIINSSLSSSVYPFQPPSHINSVIFTSTEGKRLFREAMDQGQAESFFKLMGNLSTPSPTIPPGVSSLAMTLNALDIDPKRRWKGIWRWYSGEQIKTCSPTERICQQGMPFDEFYCLAQSHCHVQAKRASVTGYQQFLMDLEHVTSDPHSQMVVHYTRSRVGQQGGAHFSPIGGHHSHDTMTLIMDVAQSHYPSVWIDSHTLYEAMLQKEEGGMSRGYFLLRHGKQTPHLKCLLCAQSNRVQKDGEVAGEFS
ncbi:Phytochelatin synthase-domain-containing protein [Spinellus fusiger]|nr:Phytochelatin synthase-domain-containing protein [Spinellus fusiger]